MGEFPQTRCQAAGDSECADEIALAEAIVALLRDPERADSMGQAGRVRVTALFSEEVMMQQLRAAYELVLRSPQSNEKTVSV